MPSTQDILANTLLRSGAQLGQQPGGQGSGRRQPPSTNRNLAMQLAPSEKQVADMKKRAAQQSEAASGFKPIASTSQGLAQLANAAGSVYSDFQANQAEEERTKQLRDILMNRSGTDEMSDDDLGALISLNPEMGQEMLAQRGAARQAAADKIAAGEAAEAARIQAIADADVVRGQEQANTLAEATHAASLKTNILNPSQTLTGAGGNTLATAAPKPVALPPDQSLVNPVSGDIIARTGPATPKPTSDQLDYKFTVAQAEQNGEVPPSFADWQTSQRTEKQQTLPTGYSPDPNNPNALIPTPGGPVEQKNKGDRVMVDNAHTTANRKWDNLDNAIETALDQSNNWTTGALGVIMSAIPGTPGHDLHNTLNTIKANQGFDELQAMRDNSPTGGALGQVTHWELELLQSVTASLQQGQSKGQLITNLKIVRNNLAALRHAKQKQYNTTYDVPTADTNADPAGIN